MSMICSCPAAASLESIPEVNCTEDFGQIQKVAFQRLKKDDGTLNAFSSEAAITALASWTTLLSAADSTKIVVSPYIQAPTAEGGAAKTFGGGNDTLDGVETIIGREVTAFTGVFRSLPQAVAKAMKQLECEAKRGDLGVFLFNDKGQIQAVAGEEEGKYMPIPIRAFFLADKTFGGLESPDGNSVQWSFLPNYSDDLETITPADFNPLTDLSNE